MAKSSKKKAKGKGTRPHRTRRVGPRPTGPVIPERTKDEVAFLLSALDDTDKAILQAKIADPTLSTRDLATLIGIDHTNVSRRTSKVQFKNTYAYAMADVTVHMAEGAREAVRALRDMVKDPKQPGKVRTDCARMLMHQYLSTQQVDVTTRDVTYVVAVGGDGRLVRQVATLQLEEEAAGVGETG